MEIEMYELRKIMIECAELGAMIALQATGNYNDDISHAKAVKIFGSNRKFENMVTLKKIKFIKGEGRNSKRIYSRIEVEALARTYKEGKL